MKFFKNKKSILTALFAVSVLLLASCSGGQKQQKPATSETESQQVVAEPVKINDEAKLLLDYLVETGDYVNTRNFPSMIKASSVMEELSGNIRIVDIRKEEDFKKGHIKGAANVAFGNLPTYFSTDIKPFESDKIILVCYTGQVSSYATCLLRLMGYGNVYAMRWGMSGWNKDFAGDWWLKNLSGKYEDQLETAVHEKAQPVDFPLMNTGKTTGEEIMNERINALFAAGTEGIMVPADKVFEQPDAFYVINYDRKDKYEDGHVPGAIRYKPEGTLGIESEMQTLPTGKPVVTYCATGHNSAFVTAYLRLFGYDAKTLAYGNNGFMHNRMVEKEATLAWQPFTAADVAHYPVVK